MNKDKALEDLFLAQKPQFDDKDAFMASLTKRLDAVEYIKQHQDATLRRYKMAAVVAFIVGIISGAIAMTYILSTPMDVPVFTFKNQFFLLQWLSVNSRFITAAAVSLLMTVGIIAFVSNIQEVLRMRSLLNVRSKI